MYSDHDTPKGWVAPFGYPRIKACSRLPMAFRSVPRPSSPPGAKASTECPSHTPYKTPVIHRQTQTPAASRSPRPRPKPNPQRQTRPHHRTQHISQTPLNTIATPSGTTPSHACTHHRSLPVRQSPNATTDHPAQPQPASARPDQTELSYAPRSAPEPDSQHKRTTHRRAIAQRHHGHADHPTLSGARPASPIEDPSYSKHQVSALPPDQRHWWRLSDSNR